MKQYIPLSEGAGHPHTSTVSSHESEGPHLAEEYKIHLGLDPNSSETLFFPAVNNFFKCSSFMVRFLEELNLNGTKLYNYVTTPLQ